MPSGQQTITLTHSYNSAGVANIIANAYQTHMGQPIKATDTLSSSFGTTPATGTGLTTYLPTGVSSAAGGRAMAIDPASGKIYVAHPDASKFAVSRFNSDGSIDTTWGTSGTYLLSSFDGGGQTPYAIAISSTGHLAVAGGGTNGIGVALLSTSSGGSTIWAVPSSGTLQAGQANAVLIDRNGDVIAAGVSGGQMVAVKLNSSNGSLQSGWGSSGVWTRNFGTGSSSTVNAILELPSAYNYDLVLGGAYQYSISAPWCCASNFQIEELTNGSGSGGAIDTSNLGEQSCNFACSARTHSINGCSGGGHPSLDAIYSLVPHGDIDGVHFDVFAVGVTNYNNGTNEFAYADYDVASDSNNHLPGLEGGVAGGGFGPDGYGLAAGAWGTAYAAAISSDGGLLYAAGVANSANDFLVQSIKEPGIYNPQFGVSPPATPDITNTGLFVTDFGTTTANSSDIAYGVATESDGTVIAGGTTMPPSSNPRVALAAYNPMNSTNIASGGAAPARASAAPAATVQTETFPSDGFDGVWAALDRLRRHLRSRDRTLVPK